MHPTRTSVLAIIVVALGSLVLGGFLIAQEQAPPETAPVSAVPVVPAPAAVARPAELPWELRPYTVSIEVTMSPSPALTHTVGAQFLAGLKARLEDDLGAMWNLTLVQAPPVAAMPVSRLSELTHETAKAQWFDHPAEKVISLAVENPRGEWFFAAREWDRASETLGPMSRNSAIDDRLSVAAGAGVVKEAFRSLVQVDAANGREINVRLRGGELTPPDVIATPLAPGNFLKPFVRAMNRKGELQKVQQVPWTLLRVEDVERARANVLAFSVFPAPVAATKKRMESLAIEVRPTYPETTLQVIPRTNKGNPIAAARVEIVDRLAAPNDPEVERTLLRTDREGKVTVPADPTPKVRYAIVHSGTGILARVPFCPGMDPFLTVDVNDDAPRLSAEGEVSLLEADLVELVARRKVLQLRADNAAKAGKVDDLKSLIAELKALPTQPQYQQRIDLSRTTAVEGAREKKDQVAEARIRKMYTALAESAKTHLDDEKFQQQLKDLQDVGALRAPGTGAAGKKK
jgi:hypothetical protein